MAPPASTTTHVLYNQANRIVVMMMIRLGEGMAAAAEIIVMIGIGILGTAVAGINMTTEIGILRMIVGGPAVKKRNLLGHISRPSTRRKALFHAWLPLAPKVGLSSWINRLLLAVPVLAACLARHLSQAMQTCSVWMSRCGL